MTLAFVLCGLGMIAPIQSRAQTTVATVSQIETSVNIRRELSHVAQRLEQATAPVTVAFMGGSITEMEGYRPMVMQSLKSRFPNATFRFVDAGVSSTCSHTGAFRLVSDVLIHQPDLLFVEFAVNDDQDAAHSYQEAVRGMEGIIRHTRQASPSTDIVMTHFVNRSMLQSVQAGNVPVSIQAHEAVAKHYDVSTCNVANELAKRIQQGTTSWEQYGGVHPAKPGNRLATDLIDQVLDAALKPASQRGRVAELPDLLDKHSYVRGRIVDDAVSPGSGWRHQVPDWQSLAVNFRDSFANRKCWTATEVGAELSIKFSGTACGAYVLAGPDAGTLEVSVDGETWRAVEQYHHHSRGLHYPRTIVLAGGLEDREHHVRIRISAAKHSASQGHAARVLHFVAS